MFSFIILAMQNCGLMEPHKVLQRLQTKISMVLQRGNARLLAARYLALEV